MIVGGQQSNSLWCSMYLGTLPWSPLMAQRSWIRFTQVIFINLTEVKRLCQPLPTLVFQKGSDAKSQSLLSEDYLAEVWHRSSARGSHPRGQKTEQQNKLSNPNEVLYKHLGVWEHASQGSLKEYISPFSTQCCKAESVNLKESDDKTSYVWSDFSVKE